MSKQWKCEDCCCFGTDACHFPSMREGYVACEHLVVDHDYAYQQGRADMYRELKGELMDSTFRNAGTMMFPKFEVKEQIKEKRDE